MDVEGGQVSIAAHPSEESIPKKNSKFKARNHSNITECRNFSLANHYNLAQHQKFSIKKDHFTVTNPNYQRIYEILTHAYDPTNCDFRFVLRNILYRGADEANHLSFQFSGDDSEEFRQAKFYLEGIILELPDMLDPQGNVLAHRRSTISEAVTLARYLIAIESAQTASQLDMLEERLESCPCSDCQGELKVA